MSWDEIDSVVGKKSVFMCRIASLFLLQRLKRNDIEKRAVLNFYFPVRQLSERNLRHSDKNIRVTFTNVCHRQNLVAQFKRGNFPSVMRLVLDDIKQ